MLRKWFRTWLGVPSIDGERHTPPGGSTMYESNFETNQVLKNIQAEQANMNRKIGALTTGLSTMLDGHRALVEKHNKMTEAVNDLQDLMARVRAMGNVLMEIESIPEGLGGQPH